jgi:hypothetical protein
MDTLSLTVTNHRHIDGFIIAANGADMTPEALLAEFVAQQGARYANDFRVGIITGTAFVARFTPQEYGDILAYAQIPPDPSVEDDPHTQVAELLNMLLATSDVRFDDPRLAPGLNLLVSLDLLDAARPAQILAYERPQPLQS